MKPLKRRIKPDSRLKRNPVCGVYEILHRPTQRRYVGSSAELEKRLYWHITMLSRDGHHCAFLQNVYNKYGPEGFETFLLETCEEERLVEREQYHMDSVSQYQLMNSKLIAGRESGYALSDEAKAKISVAAIKFSSSPEERKIRSERAKRQHTERTLGNYGKFVTPRPRVCMKCVEPFVPSRLPNMHVSGSKWCDNCRPPHRGGFYKTAPHH